MTSNADTCRTCGGVGNPAHAARDNTSNSDTICPACWGTGDIMRQDYQGTCTDCHGTGRVSGTPNVNEIATPVHISGEDVNEPAPASDTPSNADTCPACKGTGQRTAFSKTTMWYKWRESCDCPTCHGSGGVSATPEGSPGFYTPMDIAPGEYASAPTPAPDTNIPDCTCNAPSGNNAWHHEWNCARLKAMPALDTQPCANCAQLEKAHPTPYCKRFRLPHTQPGDELPDRLQLIERYSETFGLDLNSQIEAAAASQEADHVLDLCQAAYTQGRREERERWLGFDPAALQEKPHD